MLAGQPFYFGQLSNEVHSYVRTGNPGKGQLDTILSPRAYRMPVKTQPVCAGVRSTNKKGDIFHNRSLRDARFKGLKHFLWRRELIWRPTAGNVRNMGDPGTLSPKRGVSIKPSPQLWELHGRGDGKTVRANGDRRRQGNQAF